LVGLGVSAAVATGRLRRRERGGCAAVGLAFGCLVVVLASGQALGTTVRSGRAYTDALRDGRCEVVEGEVEVLVLQPRAGHNDGDRIRVGGREFRIDRNSSTPAYNRTVAGGGVLTHGARVRLHHLDGAILKVEVLR
jgi:hypothetical protein